MPYYCTVPHCTSMAGKDKNVSFHQFPRDPELAKLWNDVLKRGKPYTKYSKVCSLHFTAEDYMINNPGKHKGLWRTLRKDAVPTQNLPTESPAKLQKNHSLTPYTPQNLQLNMIPQYQNQLAQIIYLHNMMALQAAGAADAGSTGQQSPADEENQCTSTQNTDESSTSSGKNILTETEQTQRLLATAPSNSTTNQSDDKYGHQNGNYFHCDECTKCFKDPDVFTLHKRSHRKEQNRPSPERTGGKENCISVSNTQRSRQDTLQANPILANLLKTSSNFSESHMVTLPISNQNCDESSEDDENSFGI